MSSHALIEKQIFITQNYFNELNIVSFENIMAMVNGSEAHIFWFDRQHLPYHELHKP